MFETAELGHTIAKTAYNRAVPKLRSDLLDVQYRLKEDGTFPVIILISGVRRRGKGRDRQPAERVDGPAPHPHARLRRSPRTRSAIARRCGATGARCRRRERSGSSFGSWYTAPIIDRVFRNTGRADLLRSIEEINRFEKMLADEGALVLKFWFHLSKEVQRKRLKALDNDPETRWRVTKRDWDFFRRYDRFYRISGETLRATSTADAPWIVVEGADPPYRSLTVGRALLGAMKKRLGAPAGRGRPVPKAAPIVHPIDKRNVLTELDLSKALDREGVQDRLAGMAGPPQPARAPPEVPEALRRTGVRGLGRGRQGRHHPPRHRRRSMRATTR